MQKTRQDIVNSCGEFDVFADGASKTLPNGDSNGVDISDDEMPIVKSVPGGARKRVAVESDSD
jgi:hypothetical protein